MPSDPIELELFRNLFEAAAEEMGITLQRTAFSANIKERRDFSCALFDPAGRLLAQAAHIPVHLGSMLASVQAVLDYLGPLPPGQSAILNDPYAGGTHLPDVTIVTPIYHGDELVALAANRAHHADVGGSSPGSMTLSTHIDQEGTRIAPTVLTDEVIDTFAKSTRTPDERRGDLAAQLAANHVGATAIGRILSRHSLAKFREYSDALLDYAQRFMSHTIADIPDGTYVFEDVMDDDGAGTSRLPVRLTLTISGDRATADFTHSADEAKGCINCPAAVTASAVYYCFACLLPEGVPLNDGCFRNITIVTKPGSLLHATHPAPVVAGNTETSQRVVDVVFGALSKAIPDRIPAASCGTMSSLALGGDGWTYYETIGGGSGACPDSPGTSAVQCHMTNTLNTPAEALELQYPLRVLRFERARETGGKGHYAGGDGIVRELQLLSPAQGTLLTDRRLTQPYGLSGGEPASPGRNEILRGQQPVPLPGKAEFTLRPGDVLRITTPGGGGWGPAPKGPVR